jgi:hypothetical protein
LFILDGIRLELDIEWRGNNISVIEVESGKYKEEYYFKYEAYWTKIRMKTLESPII